MRLFALVGLHDSKLLLLRLYANDSERKDIMNNLKKEQPDFCGDILEMALSDKYSSQEDTYVGQDRDEMMLDALSAVTIMAQGADWSKEAFLETVQEHWAMLKEDEAA